MIEPPLDEPQERPAKPEPPDDWEISPIEEEEPMTEYEKRINNV